MLSKEASNTIFEFFECPDMGLDPQSPGYIYIYIYIYYMLYGRGRQKILSLTQKESEERREILTHFSLRSTVRIRGIHLLDSFFILKVSVKNFQA